MRRTTLRRGERIQELVYVGASGKGMGPDVIAFDCC